MSYTEIINEIENFPKTKIFACPNCGSKYSIFSLNIYEICKNCSTKVKMRGYASLGSEIEDVFDAVLHWISIDEFIEYMNIESENFK